ncbi:hypothetical protein GCM10011494_07630 [Novosphingobium endophyticum]|uniref:Uncharacterized protein n=1 Tax=Novosphingobium endophyticum TaxID=1955250 RepID=A0A916X4B1_9SPHN|nr:hypothetical protein [Novosphingobium endophyticum]GGB91712.1 hypothetical protein GCM10011494_07630 [Novosphingobium endophyticum]
MHSERNRTILKFAAPLLTLLSSAPALAQEAEPASVAGVYDGSQMEMAATLELGEDGRYRYALSYGALDEFSAGTWTRQEGGVVLDSDPSTPPRFELLGTERGSGAADVLTLRLEGTGNLPPQLFSAIVERGDGTTSELDFSEQGLEIPVAKGTSGLSIGFALPMYEVRGEPVTVPDPAGKVLYFAFHANDLGFKAFHEALLFESDGLFLLERFGREIVFRKVVD